MTNKNAYVASCAGKQTYPTKAAAHIAGTTYAKATPPLW